MGVLRKIWTNGGNNNINKLSNVINKQQNQA